MKHRHLRTSWLATALAIAIAMPSIALCDDSRANTGTSGITLEHRDLSVSPGDDFDRYANGRWQDTYTLQDNETTYGSFQALGQLNDQRIHAIVEELVARQDLRPDSDERKLRDLYASYMDVAARDAAGIAPLRPILDRIAAIDSPTALATAFGRSEFDGTTVPIRGVFNPDRGDPDRRAFEMDIDGMGMPSTYYYFDSGERAVETRIAYYTYIHRMLASAGVPAADIQERAGAVLSLETDIALLHHTQGDTEVLDWACERCDLATLQRSFPEFDWAAFFSGRGIDDTSSLRIFATTAIDPVIELVNRTPLQVWRDYLTFHAVSRHVSLLSFEIDQAAFEFKRTTLYGQKARLPQWQRSLAVLAGMDHAIGRIYIARHYRPDTTAAVDAIVANLRRAFRERVAHADWMDEATRAEALRKLERFRALIGHPKTWRDYSGVTIVPDDLVANVLALRRQQVEENNRLLGAAPDPDTWSVQAHEVSAYYDLSFNGIVLPAGILQPPFFDPEADPAANYGALGAIVGHEMSHGLSGSGSEWDSAGIARDWWSNRDRNRFKARTRPLVGQYDGYCPIVDACVNGQNTLSENTGDLTGLTIAYDAYRLSLDGREAPVIDGLTGDQRFFLAWAQVWKAKSREEVMLWRLNSGTHPPQRYRINGPLRNLDAWYRAFDVKPGDALYLPPEERVRIW